MKLKSKLHKKYRDTIVGEIKDELKMSNVMLVPKLKKIVINSGVGDAKGNKEIFDEFKKDIRKITGQEPIITNAKISISNFKIREGMPVGMKVTLRGVRMWGFLEKLVHIVLPRIKDFRGLSAKSFDGRGNYSFGIKDHTIFPEIDTNKVVKSRGIQIVISTTAQNNEDGEHLLRKLNLPLKEN